MKETITQPTFRDMPVITNQKNIPEQLAAIRNGQFPAFVIKSPRSRISEYHARFRHFDIVELIATASRRLEGPGFSEAHLENFEGLGQRKIGLLHEDFTVTMHADPFRSVFSPYVHTTIEGGGDVLMAFAGTDLDLNLQRSGTNYYQKNPDQDPHRLLLAGQVDTEIMNPNIYRYPLRAGDAIVFACMGPAMPWHRFDTQKDLGKRVVTASEILPEDAFEGITS